MKKINQELFIAILDDDPDFAYVLSRMIEKVLGAGKVQVHIQTFRTTQEADTSPLSFDLLFLDVELGNENGIQWVKKWRISFRTLLLLHPMIIMCLTVLRPVRLLI